MGGAAGPQAQIIKYKSSLAFVCNQQLRPPRGLRGGRRSWRRRAPHYAAATACTAPHSLRARLHPPTVRATMIFREARIVHAVKTPSGIGPPVPAPAAVAAPLARRAAHVGRENPWRWVPKGVVLANQILGWELDQGRHCCCLYTLAGDEIERATTCSRQRLSRKGRGNKMPLPSSCSDAAPP